MKIPREPVTFELLGPTHANAFNSVGSEGKSTSWIVVRFSAWFRRVVLLSGAQYREINHQQEPEKTSILQGWRFVALLSCILVGISLCFNVAFTIYVLQTYPPGVNGIGDLGAKSCDVVLSATTKIHIGINALAAILVAASNYNMQCMTAPSRSDIDLAHQHGRWLDIGMQSVRNLRYVPRWKAFLWLALLLSTLPLHLLWNSAVFSITTSNRYGILVVNSDYLSSSDATAGLNCTDLDEYLRDDPESYATCWLLDAAKSGGVLERLSPQQCIERYPTRLDADYSNLIAVVRDNVDVQSLTFPPAKALMPVLAYFDSVSYSPKLALTCTDLCSDWCTPWKDDLPWNCTSYCASDVDIHNAPYNAAKVTNSCLTYAIGNRSSSWRPGDLAGTSDWLCDPDYVYENGCSVVAAKGNASEWRILPERYEIDHCLSSYGLTACKLQYSSNILYIALVCNTIKFFAIAIHLVFSDKNILATVGDALASFLQRHDPNTKGKCLYTTNTSSSDQYGSQLHWEGLDEGHQPLRWERSSQYIERWHQGASWVQVFLCMLL